MRRKSMKKLGTLSISILLAVLITACGSETPVAEQPLPEQAEATAPPVEAEVPEISQPIARWNSVSERGNWVLVGYGDALNPTVVEPGTYVTINFRPSDDQVSGSGGCNNYFTTYTADDDFNLTINSPMGSTMMACESGMEQETMFLGALETVTGYQVTEDGHLLLPYDSGAVYDEQLEFIPETPLMETTWVLTAYGDPNDLTISEPGVMTTAIFSADGNLNGNTGCNNYAAGYQINEMQLSVSLPVMNLMACETGMEQEATFLQLLEKVQSYRLGIRALEITTTDGSVLRFSAQHLPLENVRWLLASIDGQAVPEDIHANVLFTPANSPAAQSEENAANGNAGCNTFFGAYTLSGDTFTAGPFGLTQMMCEDAAMQVEQAFLAGIENAQSYQITLNQLIINTETGSLLLYADRMPLEGPQWVLTGRGLLDNPQPLIEGAVFTASFDRQFGRPAGVQSGETGCNDYTATYFASADQLKVNLPQSSQNACSDAQMEAEQGYFLGLNATRDYRILGNEMQVFYDDQVLIFVGSYPEPETIEPTATVTPEITPTATVTPEITATPTEEPPEPTATEVPPEPTATEEPGANLRDTTWILKGYLADIEDDNLTEAITEIDVRLIFGDNGRVEGHAGCNTFSGRYVTDGVEILFKDILTTNVLCNEPAGIMEQETLFLALLDQVEEYRINEDKRLELIRYVTEDNQRVEKIILLFYDLSIEQR